nr:cardiolipin synthase ClsB [Rivibacter subsaxonicus]
MDERPPAEERADWYLSSRPVYSGGNEVVLLRGGDALFASMHEAIAAARTEVWVATYIFSEDPAASALAQALAAAAQRGVSVRVVVDGFGSEHSQAALQRLLGEAGAGFAVFRPLTSWRSWLQPNQLRRLHQKLCVVDARVAFVGGINLIDDRFDLHHGWAEVPRLDYAVRLRGAVVGPIEQTVRAMWTRARFGSDWRDEVRDIARDPRPMMAARRLLRTLRVVAPGQVPKEALEALPAVRAAFVVRDNLRQRRTIERAYIEALQRARERAVIVSPYFYPGRRFRQALGQAARRGVDVRLLLQGNADYRIAAMAARALYEGLLARGVRIFEYQPAFLHAKVALVDRDWATIGSSNIDPLSMLLNLEANIVVSDHGFAATLAAALERDFADSVEVCPVTRREPTLLGRARRVCVAWIARAYLRLAGFTGKY